VSGFGCPIQTKLVTSWRGEGRTAEMLRELAHIVYEEKLNDLNFHTHTHAHTPTARRSPVVDLIAVFPCLKGGYRKNEARLC